MKRWRSILWMTAVVLMCCCTLNSASASVMIPAVKYVLSNDSRAHEAMPQPSQQGYILTSVDVWQAYAEGGEKHTRVSSSAEWYVESCPDWIKLYVLEAKEETYAGETQWGLVSVQIAAEGEAPVMYPDGADVFMSVGKNDGESDRYGAVQLKLADGTETRIVVNQAQYVEKLDVSIVKPCAEAVDTIPAGYNTQVCIQMTNAALGRVQILDAQGNVLYSTEFTQNRCEFDYVFGSGCYVIRAEATGEDEIREDSDGYVCEMVTISTQELEVLEDIGVTRQYLEYVKEREGKRNKPYRDSGGKWTIGYGHLLSSEAEAKKYAARGWSDAFCEEQLLYDLKKHADIMRERLGEELYSQLTPNQFDALVSLEFNGCGRAVGSDYRLGRCLQELNTVEDWKVINAFSTWHGINNGTIDVLGLYYRRLEEAHMFLYADYSIKYNWPQAWWLNVDSSGTGTSIHDVPSGKSWYTDIIPKLTVGISLIEADAAEKTEYITIRSSRSWSIEIDEEYAWITANSYRGSNGNIVGIEVAANDGETRHGIVRVWCGATVRTIHVHQAAGVP